VTIPLEGQIFLVLASTGTLICLTEVNRRHLTKATLFWSIAGALGCLPTILSLTIWPAGSLVALFWAAVTVVALLRVGYEFLATDYA
jgi:hypothetical protein